MNTIVKHTALASMFILGTGHSLAEIQQPEPEQSQQGCETFFVHSPPEQFYPESESTESDPFVEQSVSEFPSTENGQEQSNCADQTGSSTRTQTLDFVGNLGDRIAQQRTGFGNRKVRTSSLYQPLGGAAGADDIGDSQRLSPFVVVDASESDRRSTAISRAYDQDNNAVILGFDYRLGDSLIAGATLNYLDSETEYDANQGSIDGENIILGLHGSKYWGDTYLDALLTYGQIDLDIERISPGGQFDGSTDGDFHSAELALGHLFGHKAWSITPSVRLLHLRGSLDGYSETAVGGGVGAITYNDQQFESLNARASLQADYAMLMNWGVLVPSIYFAYHHEYIGAEAVTTSAGLVQLGEDPARNYKSGRINLAAQFKRGLSGFLSYERLIDHELLDRDSLVLGVRLEL